MYQYEGKSFCRISHIAYGSNRRFAERFVECAVQYKEKKEGCKMMLEEWKCKISSADQRLWKGESALDDSRKAAVSSWKVRRYCNKNGRN